MYYCTVSSPCVVFGSYVMSVLYPSKILLFVSETKFIDKKVEGGSKGEREGRKEERKMVLLFYFLDSVNLHGTRSTFLSLFRSFFVSGMRSPIVKSPNRDQIQRVQTKTSCDPTTTPFIIRESSFGRVRGDVKEETRRLVVTNVQCVWTNYSFIVKV